MLPHAADVQIQGTAQLAEFTQRIMEDPATRPKSILFATKDFGLDRLTYRGGAGAYVDQNGGFVTRWTELAGDHAASPRSRHRHRAALGSVARHRSGTGIPANGGAALRAWRSGAKRPFAGRTTATHGKDRRAVKLVGDDRKGATALSGSRGSQPHSAASRQRSHNPTHAQPGRMVAERAHDIVVRGGQRRTGGHA